MQDPKIDIAYALVTRYSLDMVHKPSFELYASQENVIVRTVFRKINNLKKKRKHAIIAGPQPVIVSSREYTFTMYREIQMGK